MNLYGFVYNSPIGWIDYLGREPIEINIDFNKERTGFKIGPTHRSTVNGQFVPNEPKPGNRAKPGNTGRNQGPLKPTSSNVPKPGRTHIPVNPSPGGVLPGGKGGGGMVPQGGGGKGSVADAALEVLRSPAGAAWKVAHAFGVGFKKCEELAKARKAGCTPVCDCCEVTVEHLSYTNLVGGTDVIVKPARVDYWECTSCNDVLRYNDHKKKNPGFWPAGSANSWTLTARERIERDNRYDSFYTETRRYPFPQND